MNDQFMLNSTTLSVCIIGGEGAAYRTISSSDIVVNNINDAFDLLLNPKRVIATLSI